MKKENNSDWIKSVSLVPPNLKNNTADAERVIDALKTQLETDTVDIDFSLLKRLPDILRRCDYRVRCILFKDRERWNLISLTDSKDTSPILGLAIDLGTSRVVLRFINLSQNATILETSFDNPQISVGPDILTRIHFADTEGDLKHLNKLITDDLNRKINKVCKSNSQNRAGRAAG